MTPLFPGRILIYMNTTTNTTHTFPADLVETTDICSKLRVAFRMVGLPRCTGTYSLGFSPEGVPARQVFQGPLVNDLFGWLSPEATIIADHRIIDTRPVVELAVGDLVEIEGFGTFTVLEPTRFDYNYPRLEVA